LRMHQRDWIQPVRPLVRGWRFRRGFVAWVAACVRQFLAGAELLFSREPVVELRISGRNARSADLARCPHLARLRMLDLYGIGIKAEIAELLALPYLEALEELALSGNPIGDEGLSGLRWAVGLRRLRRLLVNSINLSSIGAGALARSPLSALEFLFLATNRI